MKKHLTNALETCYRTSQESLLAPSLGSPTVSIIVPTYNRAHFLPSTIASVLEQSWEAFELIIIDDGSTDETHTLLRSYDDARLLSYAFAHSGNISQRRNDGIRQARGQYIAFLDSDDLWLPDKLRLQVDVLEQCGDVGMVLCGFEIFEANTLQTRHLYTLAGEEPAAPVSVAEIFHALFQGKMPCYLSTVLFRHNLLHATGLLDERLRVSDQDFLLRLAFHTKAAILHQPLVQIRQHEGNISRVYAVEGFEQMLCAAERFYAAGAISRQAYQAALAHCQAGLSQFLRQPQDAVATRRTLQGYVRLVPLLQQAWTRPAGHPGVDDA